MENYKLFSFENHDEMLYKKIKESFNQYLLIKKIDNIGLIHQKEFKIIPQSSIMKYEIIKNRNTAPNDKIFFIDYDKEKFKQLNNVAICKNCQDRNEYMDYDPEYMCYKCRNNL